MKFHPKHVYLKICRNLHKNYLMPAGSTKTLYLRTQFTICTWLFPIPWHIYMPGSPPGSFLAIVSKHWLVPRLRTCENKPVKCFGNLLDCLCYRTVSCKAAAAAWLYCYPIARSAVPMETGDEFLNSLSQKLESVTKKITLKLTSFTKFAVLR